MMKQYYYSTTGQAIGPVDEESLQKLAQQGTINAATAVIESGQTQWSTYGALFPAQTPLPPVPPPPAVPQPPVSGGVQPTTYRTRVISSLARFWDTAYLAGFSPTTQLKEITFAEPYIYITMRDGRQLNLYQGQYEATDNLLGHAGSYNIEISTHNGEELLIRGCDAELSDTGWDEIRKRLHCKNRLF